jgi:hypothetical protein
LVPYSSVGHKRYGSVQKLPLKSLESERVSKRTLDELEQIKKLRKDQEANLSTQRILDK